MDRLSSINFAHKQAQDNVGLSANSRTELDGQGSSESTIAAGLGWLGKNFTSRLRPMAHDPGSPLKFLVPETGTSNFARVLCMHSGTRYFWNQKLGRSRTMFYSSPETWMHGLKCSSAIGRRDLHIHDTSHTQSIVCK